ncbi:hypothetical protein [Telmatospirillum sp. J64-1]|uniref:hypothetical protein n=1 Tax=Telmatospirillum sp. J64-1 TaxID=2502183 RepID=UPI00115F0DF9|nr:hypothetical protein [Telmatospirillum sp. J64-1]
MIRKTGKGRSEQGFSLVALVVVLIGIGAIAVASGLHRRMVGQQESHTATMTQLQTIAEALTAYAAANQSLPCPADARREGTTDEGVAAAACNAGTNGVVPWRTLGLSKNVATDRWGWLIAYRVDPALISNLNQTNTALALCRSLPCTPPANGTEAFVLVSTGPSGQGGFRNGSTTPNPAPVNLNELANLAVPGNDSSNPSLYFDLPANLVSQDGTPLAPSDPDHFDDIVFAMSLAQLKQVTGDGDDTPPPLLAGPSPGPGTGGIRLADLAAIEQYWGSRLLATTTENPNNRTASVKLTDGTAGKQMEFRPGTEWANEWYGNWHVASCTWSLYDFRLKNSVIRSVFEVSFKNDPTNRRGQGLVHAFLPFEINPYNNRCGAPGPFLGFSSPKTGGHSRLIQNNDFLEPLSDYRQAMAFGIELDTEHNAGFIAPGRFKDPESDVLGRNHMAVVLDNVFHDDSLPKSGSATTEYPNPGCRNDEPSCAFRDGSDSNWLEAGANNFHKVRVELEIGAGSCTASQVEVRSWIWPHGTACQAADKCQSLDQNYTTSDPNALFVSACLDEAPRTAALGLDAVHKAWDKVKIGFTSSIHWYADQRSDPIVRNYQSGSYRKWTPRPDAGDKEISAWVDAPTVTGKLNWGRINRMRSPGSGSSAEGQGWSGTSWLALPELDAELSAHNGEITMMVSNFANNPQWQTWGFGVLGIGHVDNTYVPKLSTMQRDTMPPDERERLDFTFGKRYHRALVLLTDFSSAERARLQLWQVGSPSRKIMTDQIVTACSGQPSTLIDIRSDTPFDTVSVIPEPKANNGYSDFYVRGVRLCGKDAPNCRTERYSPQVCTVTLGP